FTLGICASPVSTRFPYTTLFRSIHNSFPFSVVCVKAILLSSGDHDRLLILAFAGSPFTSLSTLSDTFFTFILLMKVVVLEIFVRSEEHTSELQSRENLVCRLLLE